MMKESMRAETGTCRFCGQVVVVDVPMHAGPDEIDEMASRMCNCDSAQAYEESIQRIQRAQSKVDTLYGVRATHPVSQSAVGLMYAIIETVEKGSIKAVSMNIDGSTKCKITKTGKGTIKVERTDTVTQTLED